MNPIHLISVVAMVALAQTELRAATITVGADPACQANTLQAALAITNSNAQDDEVRLANNMSFDHISLTKTDAQTLTIRGGFPTCASTAPLAVPTLLDGNGGSRPVIEARAGALVLENLQIEGATLAGDDTSGGGVNVVEDATRVELKNVRISRNTAHNGGGLAIVGSEGNTIHVEAEHLVLDQNIAGGNGGGLYAQYANGTVSGLLAERNHAFNNGGGVWLGRDAVLFNRNGKHRSGFYKNVAENNGGGLAIDGGGMEIFQVSPGLEPAAFYGNSARIGGGVHVFNDRPNTTAAFNASGITATRNHASEEGGFAAVDIRSEDSIPVYGGIHVSASAPPVGGDPFAYCNTAISCNVFSDNEARGSDGGARPGALISIRNQGKGAAGFARFWNSSLRRNAGYNLVQNISDIGTTWAQEIHFKNALIHGNALEKNLVDAQGFGSIYIESTTITQNDIHAPLIAGQGDIYLRGSVFTDDAPLLENITAQTSAFTLMVRNADGLSGFPLVEQNDPRFVDPLNFDFQLEVDSPALDREWNDGSTPLDLNGKPRNVDLPWVADFNTPRDLGCFERQ